MLSLRWPWPAPLAAITLAAVAITGPVVAQTPVEGRLAYGAAWQARQPPRSPRGRPRVMARFRQRRLAGARKRSPKHVAGGSRNSSETE